MMTEDVSYPFSPCKINLRENPLTIVQKHWIVQEMTKPGVTSNDLANRLGLKANSLRKIRNRLAKGHSPRDRPGRPRAIDKISTLKIAEFVGDRIEIEIGQQIQVLHEEYRNSYRRTYPIKYLEVSYKEKAVKMPPRTRGRYLSVFYNLGQEERDVDNENLELI